MFPHEVLIDIGVFRTCYRYVSLSIRQNAFRFLFKCQWWDVLKWIRLIFRRAGLEKPLPFINSTFLFVSRTQPREPCWMAAKWRASFVSVSRRLFGHPLEHSKRNQGSAAESGNLRRWVSRSNWVRKKRKNWAYHHALDPCQKPRLNARHLRVFRVIFFFWRRWLLCASIFQVVSGVSTVRGSPLTENRFSPLMQPQKLSGKTAFVCKYILT